LCTSRITTNLHDKIVVEKHRPLLLYQERPGLKPIIKQMEATSHQMLPAHSCWVLGWHLSQAILGCHAQVQVRKEWEEQEEKGRKQGKDDSSRFGASQETKNNKHQQTVKVDLLA
jgi:hypothetical protein